MAKSKQLSSVVESNTRLGGSIAMPKVAMRRLIAVLAASCAPTPPTDQPTAHNPAARTSAEPAEQPTSAAEASAPNTASSEPQVAKPSGPLCPSLATAQTSVAIEALFRLKSGLSPNDLDQVGEHVWTPQAPIGFCNETENGAWFVAFRKVFYNAGEVTLQVALAHADRAGKQTSIVPTLNADDDHDPKAFNLSGGSIDEMVVAPSLVSMQGQEVFYWHISGHFHEDVSFSRGRLFALANERVVPYEPAKGLVVQRLVDVDGDNRLDLVTLPYEQDAESCSSGFGYRITGPEFLAHQTADGSFSLTDETAQSFALRSC